MELTSLNELIEKSSKLAYNAGIEQERQRVLRVLRSLPKQFSNNDYVLRAVAKAISEIKD